MYIYCSKFSGRRILLETNDLIKRRIEELGEIKKLGVNPYPHRFDVSANSEQILSGFSDPQNEAEAEEQKKQVVSVAGRIMAIRRMGKASFCHIKDEAGRLQIYLRQNDVGENLYKVFK